MYCPQCATENMDGASFCRGCGSNISLVSQALSGNINAANQVGADDDAAHRWRHRKGARDAPNVERGIKNIFMGLAFVMAALGARTYAPGGMRWWFWLMIPAFVMLGGGVAEMVRLRLEKKGAPPVAPRPAAMPVAPPRPAALPTPNTAELVPPSVTEGTTRHLETPVKNRPNKV